MEKEDMKEESECEKKFKHKPLDIKKQVMENMKRTKHKDETMNRKRKKEK
jgi:hypothetical protein